MLIEQAMPQPHQQTELDQRTNRYFSMAEAIPFSSSSYSGTIGKFLIQLFLTPLAK